MRGKVSLILLMALLLACSALPNKTVGSVEGHVVEYALMRHNTIPVVFENGLGAQMEYWKEVIPELSKDSTTFAYNRPGYGRSERMSTPRDGEHVVDELRTLLRSQNVSPPYILVGHSLGGLYMQLFARRYPDEVAALVLVDSTHPKQLDGEGALDKQPWWARLLIDALVTGVAEDELAQLSTTGAQVLDLPTLHSKPTFVLSASKPLQEHSALADDANAKRKDIAALYPGSEQIWVDSGHVIPLEKPQAVIGAIRRAQQRSSISILAN